MDVYRLHYSDGTHQDVEAGSVAGAGQWAVNLRHDIGSSAELVTITDSRGAAHDGIDAIFRATDAFSYREPEPEAEIG